MDHIKDLYEQEIEVYKQQIHELRLRNKTCDEQNTALINKIRNMEDLIEKANQSNKDLNVAFEHVREENLRMKLSHREPEPQPAITHHEPEPRIIEAAESLSWISERDRMNQRIKFLERECGRYHRDNTTLGKQVRHLLRSLEEERGMIIRHQSQVGDDDRLVCAADVIDKHLVTFESIEQLQQQNQKLLTLVKNLSAEQEERDITVESEEVKKLDAQIKELSEQLETIKGDRERVLSALNTIHKERDLFKILLCKTRQVEHMTPEIFQRMVSVACSSGPAIEDKVGITAEKEAHIDDLKGMISKLEGYVENLRKELDTVRKESREEIQLKDQLLQAAHSKIIEETKRADVLQERNEILENNIQALTTEFDETRVKCYKTTYEIEEVKRDFEAKILDETKRADGLKDQVKTLEGNMLKITAEKEAHIDDLKGMISKLEGYVEDLRKELDTVRKESREEIQLKDQSLQSAHSKIIDETKRADVLQERNEILENNIRALTTEFDETRVKCSQSTNEIEEVKKGLEAKILEETKRADGLRDQVKTLESNMVRITAEKEAHIGDLKGMISKLERYVEDLRTELDTVRKQSREEIQQEDQSLQAAHSEIPGETEPVDMPQERSEILEDDVQPLVAELDETQVKCYDSTNEIEEVNKDLEAEIPDETEQADDGPDDQDMTLENDMVGITEENEAHIDDVDEPEPQGYVEDPSKELHVMPEESLEEIQQEDQSLEAAHSEIIDETEAADVPQERSEILEDDVQPLVTELDETQVKCYDSTNEIEDVNTDPEEEIPDETEQADDGLEDQDMTLESNLVGVTAEKEAHINDVEEHEVESEPELELEPEVDSKPEPVIKFKRRRLG